MAMHTEWHFPYWVGGRGSQIGVVASVWVSQCMVQDLGSNPTLDQAQK